MIAFAKSHHSENQAKIRQDHSTGLLFFGCIVTTMKSNHLIGQSEWFRQHGGMERMIHMSKNIVILSGSPRKQGNSDLLCDQFLKGAQEGGHQVEKIFLGEKTINPCIACDTCQRKAGQCAHKDDMAEILEKMITADVIVMATPVYFYTMNGQMKTLIDRTYARYTEISNKDMVFIMSAAVTDKAALDRTLEGFRGFTDCLSGAREKGVIYGTGAWKKGDIKGSPAMAQAYEMGKTI